MSRRVGVWLLGGKGGVATTVIVGALALERGLCGAHGLLTETTLCDGVPLPSWSDLVFGGHDIRSDTVEQSAEQTRSDANTISAELLDAIRSPLRAIEDDFRPGFVYSSGAAIDSLAPNALRPASAAAAVERTTRDLEEFKTRHGLDHAIVVNLTSTEPAVPPHPDHGSEEGMTRLVARDDRGHLIASSLYALAAARARCAFINFTPSPGALLPGVAETLSNAGVPFMGSDGKTGETLVKAALAPLFKYRNLRVLSWQGYNMLGDRDGQVLASEENRHTKVQSKDQLLHEYLGYPLHTRVNIDYVPSLGDLKTAWDFIHFQGFLGFKMSLQFTWQGCDSILAAPLVLDMVRFASLALTRREAGPMHHLGVFFKSPFGDHSHDLHAQFHRLSRYLAAAGAPATPG
ncbi:MAG: inositol-3-phosphate synthase [Planctomycetota bacterium]